MSAGELIPTTALESMDMVLAPQKTQRMGASGNSIQGFLGPTRWRLMVRTAADLSLAEARIWDAWLSNRIHLGETFTAWRLNRIYPLGALGTADGSITLSVNKAASQITLGGCGAYVASKGDMISYRTDVNGYYLGMVMADAAAVSGSVTLTMSPTPLDKHATTPAVRRVQALGEFELSTPVDPFDAYNGRQIAFEALQVLR